MYYHLVILINYVYSAEHKRMLDNVGRKQGKLRGTMKLMKYTNIEVI